MNVQPLRGPEGTGAKNMDFSRQRERELEPEILLQELAHVTRVTMLGELAGSFAHELTQPLTAVLNNSMVAKELLSKGHPDLPKVQLVVDDIVTLTRRASEVIKRLRKLLENRKVELKPVSLNKVITEIVDLVRDEAILKRIKVSTHLAHRLPFVMGDRIQLQQVFLNLLVNAFDAMQRTPARRRELIIRTFATDPRFITLEVQDSGAGIPSERLAKVFDPYFTTKSKGMGMGLSICRSIVSAHHGKISAANNPGRGATFSVLLPSVE
jgi:C4-dicarboxylate-specific signal transduction histidine kinase